MWGIIPAAGAGSRIQPLAFSKELLPVGSRISDGVERPKAVSEYLVERMLTGGVDKICVVISPGKSDIFAYFGGKIGNAAFCHVVQSRPAGLCDAIFQALPLIRNDEPVVVGLPDTVWYPEDALLSLDSDQLSFLCFPVDRPEFFDAVVFDDHGRVEQIQVKSRQARSNWIWGAFKFPGKVLHELYSIWIEEGRRDEYIGTLVNEWLSRGGRARAVCAGEAYVDVGTLHGYREAIRILAARQSRESGKAVA